MYEEHFGLKQKPFSKTPDPAFLYESPMHREALARLEYAVEERELALLTGEIGSGKTTLTRALMDRAGETNDIVLITNPRLTPAQLLRNLAQRLDVQPDFHRADLIEQINEALYARHQQGRGVVLILDEAQLIPGRSTFEEIRLLTNFQLDDQNLITVILVGQPELAKRLKHPAYEALRQRIGLRYHLTAMDAEETGAYVRHRLKVAGCSRAVFKPDALDAVHRFTGGVPRLINGLANTCLLEAFGKNETTVNTSLVEDAARELDLLA